MKQVQIPEELFSRIYAYFMLERQEPEQIEAICRGLQIKMDAIQRRSEYKDSLLINKTQER